MQISQSVELQWLDVAGLARVSGICPRVARRALQRGFDVGTPWRGHVLEVRMVRGRGGKSGRAYEVLVRSLPEAIQAVLSNDLEAGLPAVQTATHSLPAVRAAPRRAVQANGIGAASSARLAAVEEICCHPRGSAERTAILKTVAARDGIPERTLYDLCRRYDERGRAAFIHGSTGKRTGQRVAVSRKFDAAFAAAFLKAGGSQEALAKALDELRDYINLRAKAEWASPAGRIGANEVRLIVSGSLKEDYFQRPVAGILAALPAHQYQVTRDRVDKPAFRNFRIVDEIRHDRKKFQDNAPHITRDWTCFAPMERVIADVKPLDVAVKRSDDGSVAYPRLVAFLDAGTQRMFYRVFLCPKGQNIRQEHIIETFMAMVRDPEWGVPRGLYIDNGSEFAAFDKIAHFLNQIAPDGKRSIIKALPYAAASKPIEGIFGSRLDRYVINQMKGWTGGDRMKSKVSNVGKKPDAYPDMFDAFCKELAERIEDMMLRPIHGARNQWAGRSAREIFENKRRDGWCPIRPVNPFALKMVFWKRVTKKINRGVIRHDRRNFRHPTHFPASGKYEVLIPPGRDENPILILADGTSIQLQEDYPFPADDQAGAKEAGRRKRGHIHNVREMAGELPPSDADRIRRIRIESANALFPPREPVPLLPAIDTGGENDRAARAVVTAKKSPPKLSTDEAQKAAANQMLMLMEKENRAKENRAKVA